MPTKRLTQIFKDLTFDKKLVGLGSVLMIISVFLPWYQDLDSFKTGDMFLGITGPMYLAGLSLLVLSGLNLFLLFMDYTGRKISRLPVKSPVFYIAVGIFAFYMLIFVNSVYFHAKFGINITLKQSQFGMFTAFIAASFVVIGGYLSMKDKKTILKEFQEKIEEPIIQVPQQERKPDTGLKNIQKEDPAPVQSEILNTTVNPQSVEQMQMENLSPPQNNPDEHSKNIEPEKEPQPFRMDL